MSNIQSKSFANSVVISSIVLKNYAKFVLEWKKKKFSIEVF